jgi:hypothetical protein
LVEPVRVQVLGLVQVLGSVSAQVMIECNQP